MPTALARQAPEQVLYKIPEVMAMLRMSRHVVYEQIRAGRLRIVKQGRAASPQVNALANPPLHRRQPENDAAVAEREMSCGAGRSVVAALIEALRGRACRVTTGPVGRLRPRARQYQVVGYRPRRQQSGRLGPCG